MAKEFGVPVRVLLGMLDSREISEWIAYFHLMHEQEKERMGFDKKQSKPDILKKQAENVFAKFLNKDK